MSTTTSSEPLGVKVLAFMTALDGLLALVWGLEVLAVALPVGLLLVGIGVVQLLVGYGLWKMDPLAYSLGMGTFALGAAADLLTGNLHAAGLSVLNMYILYHYRDHFRRRR